MTSARTSVLLACLLCCAPVGAAPPDESLDRAATALDVLDGAGFAGSYVVRSTTVVSKLNGKKRQVETRSWRVERRADGSERRVRLEDGGEPPAQADLEGVAPEVAEAERQPETDAAGDPDGDGVDDDVLLPLGEDRRHFRFGPTRREGALAVASFEPAEAEERAGASRGRFAWHPEDLDPAWLEAELVERPRGLKHLSLRFELDRTGGLLHLRSMTVDGVAGIAFIKRKFRSELLISDVAPEP